MQRFSWASRFLGASTFVNNLFLNTVHCGMRDESWHFLSTFLENLAIEVLFNADFNGVVQIIDFRQAITIKNYNLSFCTCLDKYISFLEFSITFWGF